MSALQPAWHSDALCAHADDPRDYDVDHLDPRDQILESMEKCLGCPVIRECALEGREQRADAVIRAGVPCIRATWTRSTELTHEVMTAICAGHTPIVALIGRLLVHAETTGKHRYLRDRLPALISMAVEAGYLAELAELDGTIDQWIAIYRDGGHRG